MSPSHDHAAQTVDAGYGAGQRSGRPLLFLIPIGIALAIVLVMLAEGVHVMTMPVAPSAGETHLVQTAVPDPAPRAPA